jgi:EAL domain-containing protein (putative c-di-GMP-specific phosphodiesterase class I)
MLKIDRSFIHDLPNDENARQLVPSIIQLAHNLNLEPVAEGVETDEQRRYLLDHHCRHGQGFLFSRPIPAQQLEKLYSDTQDGYAA